MDFQIYFSNGEVTVRGDDVVLTKAQAGNGNLSPESVSIEGMRVDVDVLEKLHNKASFTGPVIENIDGEDVVVGYPIAKQYVALKQAFLHQQELAKIERDKPEEQHEPAMTSQSIKPVDAD